jgi:hypothetical protein
MRIFGLIACLAALPAWAQPILTPTAASTRLYFAQLADGGPVSQNWETTLLFINPGAVAASATVSFHGDSGQPEALDFGQGAGPGLAVSLPAGGTVSLTSAGASANTAVGWALAISSTPLLGTVIYRATTNGTPSLEVAANGSGTTYQYTSFADPNVGIALANPSATQSVHLVVAAKSLSGAASGTASITLPPNGHTAFDLGQQISTLPAGFSGSITITSSDIPPAPFFAWTLAFRDNFFVPLPAGEVSSPPPYDRRVYDAFARLNAAMAPMI